MNYLNNLTIEKIALIPFILKVSVALALCYMGMEFFLTYGANLIKDYRDLTKRKGWLFKVWMASIMIGACVILLPVQLLMAFVLGAKKTLVGMAIFLISAFALLWIL